MGVQERLTTVISTKGQVILPKAIRDQRQWGAGTKLTVEETADGVLLKPAPAFAPSTVDAVFASLKYEGTALSIDEMDVAVAREAKRRARD
ncbi:AbrB/MazE/SpoVT family DNA-binding domain-containing protein [Novosphingobium sp. JCM 18896]|uniref:AbrB/MazE/SpoVT family DNA-binding domain-containing protein n=1 Tax=Novosphingobium sp. JCM 18896 TaxID=2989731 RepID=UPI002222B268|nr:AbrB/MazE/SpoVT family DNA-binding domain-containing protein [Novosphingobium sp. JCM 18896]MCW1431055.1 AbrB/MazE/SpoVT family DNA-binding domain-containing protein [Novosphingobium sp. JCM 18896]